MAPAAMSIEPMVDNEEVQKKHTYRQGVVAFVKSPFKAYTGFMCVALAVHHLLFDNQFVEDKDNLIGYCSIIFESYALISVWQKINEHRSVIGISGNSLLMCAISYVLRQTEAPLLALVLHRKITAPTIFLEVFQCAVIPLVLTLVWAVFKTYRETYQESSDKLKVKYLLPCCVALALVLRPTFRQGQLYSFYWTLSFYVDVLALLPQVVMMTYTPGKKIAVPIANFVAVTAVSRCMDLCFWYLRFDLGPQGWWGTFNYSGWIIVSFHIISLLLVADFMYYYLRARCAAYVGEDKQAVRDEASGVVSVCDNASD